MVQLYLLLCVSRSITYLEETQASLVLPRCAWMTFGLSNCVGLQRSICFDTADTLLENTGVAKYRYNCNVVQSPFGSLLSIAY